MNDSFVTAVVQLLNENDDDDDDDNNENKNLQNVVHRAAEAIKVKTSTSILKICIITFSATNRARRPSRETAQNRRLIIYAGDRRACYRRL